MKQQLGPKLQQLQEGSTETGDEGSCPLQTPLLLAVPCKATWGSAMLQRAAGSALPISRLHGLEIARCRAQDLLLFCPGLPSFEFN